jgi:ribosomal protein L34
LKRSYAIGWTCGVRRLGKQAGFAVLLIVGGVSLTHAPALGSNGSVFRSASLIRSMDRKALVVRTNGVGPHASVVLRSHGLRVEIKRLRGTTANGRWVVNRQTAHGRNLLRALTTDLNESGVARLRATAHFPCGSRSRSKFAIHDYNDPAPAHFVTASACA